LEFESKGNAWNLEYIAVPRNQSKNEKNQRLPALQPEAFFTVKNRDVVKIVGNYTARYKAVQNTKRERWYGEENHCGNGLAMISEEHG
jgi:hypothetical protein